MTGPNGVVGQSGSGIAWQLSPNANSLVGSPLRLNCGKVACAAGITTSVTYWAKFSAAGPSGQFRVFGGRYAGVGSPGADITVPVTGTAWAQYTISFTSSENAVIDIFFETWGSSTQTATVSGPVVINQ